MSEMIDMSGQPRSDKDLQEAIDACKEIMIKHSLVLPLFTIHATDIVNCLEELQMMRRLLAEAKRKRSEKTET